MKSKEIKPGLIFAIPIEDYFVVGLITRKNDSLLLGSFFKDKYSSVPSPDSINFKKDNILITKLFGEAGLTKYGWVPLGDWPLFKQEDWPVPAFKRQDVISDKYYKIIYNDQLKEIKKEPMNPEEKLSFYVNDGIAGYKAMEIIIAHELKKE